MIRVITIDLDDTLWEAGPALLRAEAAHYAWVARRTPRIAARYSAADLREMRRELAERRPDIAHDFTRLRHTALVDLLRTFEYDESLAADGIEHFLRVRSQVDLYGDTEQVLGTLARDYILVALTNGNADLELAGVAQHFAACVSPAEAGVRKPDPAMFHVALAEVGAHTGEAVHVGDHPLYDIEGAHRAAMRTVWLNRDGREWPAEYRRPSAEISVLTELPALLRTLAQQMTK